MSNRPASMIPALLALLPALALSGWTRAYIAEKHSALEPVVEVEDADRQVVLEVLIAEGGYRLRISEPEREGWQPPLRTARRTRLDGRETFVALGPGLPPSRVVTAAEDLLEDGERPLVQLRAEDAIPWARVLEAGEALEPLLGRPLDTSSLLAGMLVDARP
ncbi:MAG: hypothetical protein KDA24_10380 [Deltaproteobacteria bacterium]|nr:hypothetical protein [Deltaproteobacteria bacterium]